MRVVKAELKTKQTFTEDPASNFGGLFEFSCLGIV